MLPVFLFLYLLSFLSLYRLFVGPTFQDRILALSLVNSSIVLILCTLSVQRSASFYLDAAIVYALLSFGEIIVFVKLHRIQTRKTARWQPHSGDIPENLP